MTLAGEEFVHDFAPMYLGVTIDRSLTYREYTDNVYLLTSYNSYKRHQMEGIKQCTVKTGNVVSHGKNILNHFNIIVFSMS